MALRLFMDAMNDTMVLQRLVPSLLIFVVLPFFAVTNKPLPVHRYRMAALSMARAELTTVTVERPIVQVIKLKLPPAVRFFEPGKYQYVGVYKGHECRWGGAVRVVRRDGKEVFYRQPHVSYLRIQLSDTFQSCNL